jgi:hypothetical protein
VIGPPPSTDIFPPEIAELIEISETAKVEIVGRTMALVEKDISLP